MAAVHYFGTKKPFDHVQVGNVSHLEFAPGPNRISWCLGRSVAERRRSRRKGWNRI